MIIDWLIDVFVGIVGSIMGWLDSLIPADMNLDFGIISQFFGISSFYIDFAPWLLLIGGWLAVYLLFIVIKLILFVWRLLPLT